LARGTQVMLRCSGRGAGLLQRAMQRVHGALLAKATSQMEPQWMGMT
jgi:hypothetical protein